MATADPARAVLYARIRLALRRATGLTVDVDSLLGDPTQAARHTADWRTLGVADLDRLLDQLQGAAPTAPASSAADRAAAAGSIRSGIAPQATAGSGPAAPPADPPPDPAKPPPERRYLRGAR